MKTTFLASLFVASAALAAPEYTLVDLGTLGGNQSYGLGINDKGQVVGYSKTSVAGQIHAFLHDDKATPKLKDLGTLGGDDSYAYGIDAQGRVVGAAETTPTGGGSTGVSRAFLYDASATPSMKDLGTFGGTTSQALAIGAGGRVVGFADDAADKQVAFLYDPAATPSMKDLGSADVNASSALAINAQGQIAGGVTFADGTNKAFLYDPAKMPAREDLDILGSADSGALGINAKGRITGYYFQDATNDIPVADYRAFLYDASATPKVKDLGTLGGSTATGYAVASDGAVFGESDTGSGPRGFRYRDGKMVDINTLIASANGVVVTAAYAVNASGQVAGWGTVNNETHALRLDPIVVAKPVAKPVVAISGKKKLTTTKAAVVVKGTATGTVTEVKVANGKKTVRAAGTTSWSVKVKVKPGLNKLTVTATGPGGISAPVKMTVVRK